MRWVEERTANTEENAVEEKYRDIARSVGKKSKDGWRKERNGNNTELKKKVE